MRRLIDRDDTLKIIADTISLYGTGTRVESEILSIVSKIPCEEPWNIVKSTLNELERKEEKLYSDFSELEKRIWIPVTERLPEEDGMYLISHQNGKVFLDKWVGYDGWENFISVKAWMPLPEAYQPGVSE